MAITKMSDSKAEAKGGGGAKGGGDSKGGGGDSKGGAAEAKGSGGQTLDTVAPDHVVDNASNRYRDIKALAENDICIVKRSDGTWRYAKVDEWEGILLGVYTDPSCSDDQYKQIQVDKDNMDDCEVKAIVGSSDSK